MKTSAKFFGLEPGP